MSNYDSDANLSTLKPEWVSMANARQRRGRAGRVKDGVCFHLFSKARRNLLEEYSVPVSHGSLVLLINFKVKKLESNLKCSAFIIKNLESNVKCSAFIIKNLVFS